MELIKADVTVVGGGIAGICAAIAAARQGLQVSLINDRPVLGGMRAVRSGFISTGRPISGKVHPIMHARADW
ncbi:FAD-dependent oxidoreductase [Paenibacillus rhizoplanae]